MLKTPLSVYAGPTHGVQPKRRANSAEQSLQLSSSSLRSATRISSDMEISLRAASSRTCLWKSSSNLAVKQRGSWLSACDICRSDALHHHYNCHGDSLKQRSTYLVSIIYSNRMVSNQSDGTNPRITASVPTNHKQALDFVAMKRSTPGNRSYTADVVRQAIEEWLKNHYDELPGEAKDLLDDDLKANGGNGNITVEVSEGAEN